MNDRFKKMTDSMVNRIDEMSERIDDLEKTVCKLVEDSNGNEGNINHKQLGKQGDDDI